MYEKENENNYCEIIGTITSAKTFSHESFLEKFYMFSMKIERLSKSYDYVNVTISERFIDENLGLEIGDKVRIKGQFRSYNNFSGVGNKLILTLFVKEIENYVSNDAIDENYNFIKLNGFLCKEPVYRLTPFGREIADMLLAVNRVHNKSDYIPCIAWGRNAKFVSSLSIGDNIDVEGRIQSREYVKKYDDENTETKVAYEVSISKIEKT